MTNLTNNITVTGTQKFMHTNIPVVLGGFGEGRKCITDKTIAEIHGVPITEIRKTIGRNESRFKNMIDFIDLKIVGDEITNNQQLKVFVQNDDNLLKDLGYSKMQVSKAEHIYLLSERGYAKLIKIMDTDLAWDIHDKLMDEYFKMRDVIIPNMADVEDRVASKVMAQMEATFTKYFVELESTIMGLDSKIYSMENSLDSKIEVACGAQKKVHLDYMECLPDSPNNTYQDMRNKASQVVSEIKSYGGYQDDQKVFSRIYTLMKQKSGIDINKCKEDYIRQHPNKPQATPWMAIVNSQMLFTIFMDIASEMLNQLKTYGSSDEYIISTNFDESLTQVKLLANDRYDSDKLKTYREIYKCMEDQFGVDWKSINYKKKMDAVKNNTYLQEIFTKAVNHLQYRE